jgi:coenzyme F420 hydrogenase subunit beta
VPTPVNTILSQMTEFKGRLAFVGLPDQVASLRYLQSKGHPGALRVNYVLGPYVGTMMYLDAIQSFLRSNGYFVLDEIESLRYRQGEWPGYLSVKMRSGHELRADKFYYNYLIPFYITDSTLMSVDFTNELTDISVGDAWNPDYESQGAGFSVVLARTEKALEVLNDMGTKNLVSLDEIEIQDALSMHGHMLDFKKRGTFIRMNWRKERGKPVPDYGYLPFKIPLSRILVEVVISAIFLVCRTKVARKVVEWFPISIIGPFFNNLRISWKAISKPTKRKGLDMTDYMLVRRD